MMKYLLSGVVALAIAATAFAGFSNHQKNNHNRPHNNHNHNHNKGNHYHHNHGHHFNHGWYYKGKHHKHWSHRQWHRQHRCWVFYDSGVRVWYYYCVPAGCFYPVSYCPYNTYHWDNDDFCNENCRP